MTNDKLDSTDLEILEQLLKDARLSFREIARRTNLSIGTILNRIRAMERKKVIRGYSAVLDHEKMGYELSAIIEITVAKGKLMEIEKKIAHLSNVCGVYDVTGLTDSVVIAKFKNRKELNGFVKQLLKMENIERTNTHIVLNTVKEDFSLL